MISRKIIFGLLLLFIFGCNKNKGLIIEYQSNKLPYKKYTIKDGVLDRVYLEYFSDGKLKEKHIYRNGIKTDSSLLYNHNPYYLKQVEKHNKQDTLKIKNYDVNSYLKEIG